MNEHAGTGIWDMKTLRVDARKVDDPSLLHAVIGLDLHS